jgi:hypothetical protein
MSDLPQLAFMRITIPGYQTVEGEYTLDATGAAAKTRELLGDATCLFSATGEYLGRCSPLELVQSTPYPILRTNVLLLKWMRITDPGTQIKLMPTDLSLSGYGNTDPVETPENFTQMNTEEKTAACVEALAQQTLPTSTPIAPEILPVTARVLLPAPSVVMVGSMFLVRLRLLTRSGGPRCEQHVACGYRANRCPHWQQRWELVVAADGLHGQHPQCFCGAKREFGPERDSQEV